MIKHSSKLLYHRVLLISDMRRWDYITRAFSVGTTLQLGKYTYELQPVSWLRGKVAELFKYDLILEDPSYGPNM